MKKFFKGCCLSIVILAVLVGSYGVFFYYYHYQFAFRYAKLRNEKAKLDDRIEALNYIKKMNIKKFPLWVLDGYDAYFLYLKEESPEKLKLVRKKAENFIKNSVEDVENAFLETSDNYSSTTLANYAYNTLIVIKFLYAEKEYDKVIALNRKILVQKSYFSHLPKINDIALFNLGVIHFKKGEDTSALKKFYEIKNSKNIFDLHYYYMAKIYKKIGNKLEADSYSIKMLKKLELFFNDRSEGKTIYERWFKDELGSRRVLLLKRFDLKKIEQELKNEILSTEALFDYKKTKKLKKEKSSKKVDKKTD